MISTKITAGSIVQLRSGGPLMTVRAGGRAVVFCEWFSDDSVHQSRSFRVASLKVIEPGPEPEKRPDRPKPPEPAKPTIDPLDV